MKRFTIIALLAAGAAVVGYAFAEVKGKEEGVEQQVAQLSAKIDSVLAAQAKLDTILENQEKIIQMLRVIRAR